MTEADKTSEAKEAVPAPENVVKGPAGGGQFLGEIRPESHPTKSLEELVGKGKTRAELNFPDVRNDYELDNVLIGQTVRSNGCIIDIDSWQRHIMRFAVAGAPDPTYVCDTKPVAAYLVYVKKDSIAAGVQESYSLKKKKGYSRQSTTSVEVKTGVSAGIFSCETSLEVSTGYSYSETITDETEETWTKTLTGPQDYWTFQPAIIYATRVAAAVLKHLPSQTPRYVDGETVYVFSPVFRNSPSVIDHEIGYLSLQTVLDYLCKEAWGRW